jgi:dolichol kinase
MVLIIAPGIFMDELMSFTILALGVALCAFFVLETYRVTVLVPLLDDCITSYYRLFLDEKDLTGYWVSSNISLLIGCAFPVVLWAYWNERRSCVNVETGLACSFPSKMQYGVCRSENARVVSNVEMLEAVRPLLPHLGWITVGVGDSFAAILGYRYGIHKWRGTSRTVEGSVAMFMSMAFVSFCTLLVGLNNPHISLYDNVKVLADSKNILPSVIALSLTTLMEAFTSKNDNWVLPLFAVVVFVVVTWIHLCYNR